MLIWILILVYCSNQSLILFAQQTDSSKNENLHIYKPEVLTSGFIDLVSNGQLNASARLIRIFVGEPGKFSIPLSVYSGVSSNNFQSQQSPGGTRTNEILVNNFINPLSGVVNLSLDGFLGCRKRLKKTTRSVILYQGGIRLLTGYRIGPILDPSSGRPINFLNSFALSGLYFQTGAWERNNARNVGIFWIAFRYIICYSSPAQLEEIVPGIVTNGIYHGWSIGWGIEINNLINIKVIYYKFVKAPEIEYSLPIYQFSFNYTLK